MDRLDSLNSHLPLSPLGPGDLIDRAVRFYRQNFYTFLLIASPPVVVGTLISVGWTFVGRSVFTVGGHAPDIETFFYYVFTWFGSMVIWLAETVATLAVMGGASRNFVRHLLFGEAITFRETYANTWKRIGGLIAGSTFVALLLGSVGGIIFYFGFAIGLVIILLVIAAFGSLPIVASLLSLIIGLATVFGTLWLFFLLASRFAYIPQVMVVEGLGVFAAIGRGAALASGNVMRLAALFTFTSFATYSALAILYVPLGWYAWYSGVEIMTFGFDADLIPVWYEVAYQLIWQLSFILMSPIWMVGLCLLYVDERVRHEGYDIELMAARRLGNIPGVPPRYVNPLQPALQDPASADSSRNRSGLTTLGLK